VEDKLFGVIIFAPAEVERLLSIALQVVFLELVELELVAD
jgi:hypothetical protein